jgi:hypothetical protein
MIGVFRIPFLEYDTRVQQMPDRKWGYLSSALMGVFFSAGWAPCVGPVLGAILTLALNGGSVSTGVSLLSAYSAGLAIPFLIAALGVGWVSITLRKYGKVARIEIAMGHFGHSRAAFSPVLERCASGQFFWIDFGSVYKLSHATVTSHARTVTYEQAKTDLGSSGEISTAWLRSISTRTRLFRKYWSYPVVEGSSLKPLDKQKLMMTLGAARPAGENRQAGSSGYYDRPQAGD